MGTARSWRSARGARHCGGDDASGGCAAVRHGGDSASSPTAAGLRTPNEMRSSDEPPVASPGQARKLLRHLFFGVRGLLLQGPARGTKAALPHDAVSGFSSPTRPSTRSTSSSAFRAPGGARPMSSCRRSRATASDRLGNGVRVPELVSPAYYGKLHALPRLRGAHLPACLSPSRGRPHVHGYSLEPAVARYGVTPTRRHPRQATVRRSPGRTRAPPPQRAIDRIQQSGVCGGLQRRRGAVLLPERRGDLVGYDVAFAYDPPALNVRVASSRSNGLIRARPRGGA